MGLWVGPAWREMEMQGPGLSISPREVPVYSGKFRAWEVLRILSLHIHLCHPEKRHNCLWVVGRSQGHCECPSCCLGVFTETPQLTSPSST